MPKNMLEMAANLTEEAANFAIEMATFDGTGRYTAKRELHELGYAQVKDAKTTAIFLDKDKVFKGLEYYLNVHGRNSRGAIELGKAFGLWVPDVKKMDEPAYKKVKKGA